jgi:hypothetical protein
MLCTNLGNLLLSKSNFTATQETTPQRRTMASSTEVPEQKNEHPETSNSWFSGIKTPGVANIEAAYSRAGATNHHTPGHASKLGSQDQTPGSEHHQGVGSEKFANGMSDQRTEV